MRLLFGYFGKKRIEDIQSVNVFPKFLTVYAYKISKFVKILSIFFKRSKVFANLKTLTLTEFDL